MNIFSNRCAKCKQGAIFHGFFFIHDNCPVCGHRFEREEGFFIGSMIIAYFISTLLTLPILLVSIFKFEMEFPLALLLAAVFMAVTLPIIYRYSKIAWIQIEERLYQSFKTKRES
jgi:uncharacterized protein (DUF983 family)